jgi:hypothetical protein
MPIKLKQIAGLRQILNGNSPIDGAALETAKPRRKMSAAAGRKAIIAATKRRRAAVKKARAKMKLARASRVTIPSKFDWGFTPTK